MLPPPDVRPGRNPAFPAGPAMLTRLLEGEPLRHNTAEFLLRNARNYGDLCHYRFFNRHVYQINHPELLSDFFGRDASRHHRNIVMQRSREVLGHGLLTSEEPLHMRQRRLAQPAFLRERIAGYAAVIGAKTQEMTDSWPTGTVVDLHPAMLDLALRIVGKCLFDLDTLDDVAAIASAVDSFMSFLPLSFLPLSRHVQRLPLPAMRRLARGKDHLDRWIYRLIAERRADPTDRGDLLSMLLSATDDASVTEDDQPGGLSQAPGNARGAAASHRMSDRQLHDECVTIILAGHETTANALSFALHLLAHHPAAQERLHQESCAVLGERRPSASDYPKLPYSTAIFAEAMRLYPPVWVTARTAIESYSIAGYTVPVGATLLAPQFAVHRDPRFYPDPERFDPERFTPERRVARPRLTYFPFGGGSRQCIAEGLAWMEGTLALAVIARDWRLSAPAGSSATPALKPAITLRPAKGVRLRLDRRTPAPAGASAHESRV